MEFDIETVKELSRLSKIELKEEETLSFQKELAKIIGHFELLGEVDTDDVDLYQHYTASSQTNIVREDQVEASPSLAEKILANVPKKTGRIITVPALREGDE